MLEHPVESTVLLREQSVELGNQQERRDAAVYLAAMVQGEGSILVYPNKLSGRKRNHTSVLARVVVYNSDTDVLNELERRCRMVNAGHYRYQHKKMGVVMVNGFRRLAKFLPVVIPFLVGSKKTKAEHLYRLSIARSSVDKTVPYEPWQMDVVNALCPGKRSLESSQTNMSPVAIKAIKIEPGPDTKVSGGERVSKYPALAAAL